jgi:hypothetical protein
MKAKTKFLYGIIAIFTFLLVLAACPTETSPKIPSINGTSKLTLSGQVYNYEQNTNQDTEQVTALLLSLLSPPEKFKSNLNISDGGLGGSGEIKDGKLNYNIEEPQSLLPIDEGLKNLQGMYEDLKFSPEGVSAAPVALQITDSEDYSGLLKSLLDIKLDFVKPVKITAKTVNYIYVDKDLKITADKKTFDNKDINNDFGPSIPISLTTEKISLSLKKGWNSLYSEINADIPMELISTIMGSDSSGPVSPNLKLTGTLKMSVSDPGNLNWTLIPSQPYDDNEP